VAAGRVFVADFEYTKRPNGIERALAFDEQTGRQLWSHEWTVNYTGLATTYATGPRATPIVDGDRVYFFGAMGRLLCLRAVDGEVLWEWDFVKDFGTEVPVWGMSAAPLVDGPRLIALAGGEGNAKVMAFDKLTGKVLWRALSSDFEPGYSAPVIVTAGGRRQLIQWHPEGVASLDPETGKQYWELPFRTIDGIERRDAGVGGLRVLISSFFNGSMMVALDDAKPGARMLWRGKSNSETKPDGLHALAGNPMIDGDYIYGICAYGELRCLRVDTGEQVWETLAVMRERARMVSGAHGAQWRPLFHQQRPGRVDHRPAVAEGLRGDQQDEAD
jgi:outer membrane protein assembly factor BamB